jgi:hypothetical protein
MGRLILQQPSVISLTRQNPVCGFTPLPGRNLPIFFLKNPSRPAVASTASGKTRQNLPGFVGFFRGFPGKKLCENGQKEPLCHRPQADLSRAQTSSCFTSAHICSRMPAYLTKFFSGDPK